MASFHSVRTEIFFCAWALLVPLVCCAQSAHISAAQATAHVGEYVTVEGTVASVHASRKGHTYINFGASYPRQDFTAVVFASNARAFNGLMELSGKRVRITGVVRLYQAKPEIVLETASQLTVLQ